MKLKENVIARLDMSRNGIKKLKFEEIYDSVDDCVNELSMIPDSIIKTKLKGCEYLISFKKQVLEGRNLSKKQIIQLKRLAPEVARGCYLFCKNCTGM